MLLKKTMIAAGALTVVGGVLLGTDVPSYVCTVKEQATASVLNQIPVDFEIQRARDMVSSLREDIRNNIRVIAREEVEVEYLETEVGKLRDDLQADRERVLKLRESLATDENPRDRAELAGLFEIYKTKNHTLQNREKLLEARIRSLESAREKLGAMVDEKSSLEIEVESLAARLKAVEATETSSDYQFDNSRLSQVKRTVEEIRKRIETEVNVLEAEQRLIEQTEPGVLPEAPRDLDDREIEVEVDAYFKSS